MQEYFACDVIICIITVHSNLIADPLIIRVGVVQRLKGAKNQCMCTSSQETKHSHRGICSKGVVVTL